MKLYANPGEGFLVSPHSPGDDDPQPKAYYILSPPHWHVLKACDVFDVLR